MMSSAPRPPNHEILANQFLEIAPNFYLGNLPTEKPNPATKTLSDLAQTDVAAAVAVLHGVDKAALPILVQQSALISRLSQEIQDTFNSGNRVYLFGCGATGRLSLTAEFLWRGQNPGDDRVRGFMSGGDIALIRSVEKFEDMPEYGARHLEEMGFVDGDLLISTTEGGETPIVIGATERAAEISRRRPYFLYCNPDDLLCQFVERSRRVIENPQIEKINLSVGPMSISGSTRMQASTVLLGAVALALLDRKQEPIEYTATKLVDKLSNIDLSFLAQFTERESEIYKRGEYVLYKPDLEYAMTVITDTTERAPTFSLTPFENVNDPHDKPALAYMVLPQFSKSENAWAALLFRQPRPLEWQEQRPLVGAERLYGFDLSQGMELRRRKLLGEDKQHDFKIIDGADSITLELDELSHTIETPGWSPLERHELLKIVLNTHSTLVMGRLGRYEGNIMTWVRPSNNKLIDRAIRYVSLLLEKDGISKSYEEICRALFKEAETLQHDESIVLKTRERLKN